LRQTYGTRNYYRSPENTLALMHQLKYTGLARIKKYKSPERGIQFEIRDFKFNQTTSGTT
jgi:hypothetical protein